ncbi:Rrf2 family transcriptional regulator [Parvibaculum sp.]|uniref:RrF2 family transcriptional regulator n=1 Tax=Parvibaculum sp. TaxID=2024848 RepID=UPI0027307EE0|nr:Rrf2 family transcriptional regulator [Parvibaculum sp.]MDP1625823.1 Rrf2 family transcriptional regulator [Parvibaculum sp.]MDP2149186.1 Rrf2 family transcriptional regulator [Parvibaculum sp.]MDP3329078.1 Rrf2 family transcriptional regulator [Parvibaculum sp.]
MLSQKAKYALKAMIALATQEEGDLLQAADIAERQNVPRKFLELILLDLRKHGLVRSQRGKFGGYALAKPADAITFGQIIRIMDGPLAPIPCASLTGYRRCADCRDEKSCAVRRTMREVRDAAAAILDGTTIADALGAGAHEARAAIGA